MSDHDSCKITSVNPKRVVANLLLGGISLYCLKLQVEKDAETPLVLLGWAYSAINAALTILLEFMNEPCLQKVQHFMDKSSTSVTLPSLASTFMMHYDFDETITMVNLALPIVFLYFYFTNNEDSEVIKIQAGGLICFLGALSTMNENYYGLASAICYMINLYHQKIPDRETGDAVKALSETLGHLMIYNAMEFAEDYFEE